MRPSAVSHAVIFLLVVTYMAFARGSGDHSKLAGFDWSWLNHLLANAMLHIPDLAIPIPQIPFTPTLDLTTLVVKVRTTLVHHP